MSSIEALPWRDYLTFSAAMVGAILGVINMWNTLNQSRVRLRVAPKHAVFHLHERGFAIEVLNLSAFSVTISEVGFQVKGKGVKKATRAVIVYPTILDGKSWPRRLDPRDAVSAYLISADLAVHRGKKLGKAYATTACGVTQLGDSPALAQLREELAKE